MLPVPRAVAVLRAAGPNLDGVIQLEGRRLCAALFAYVPYPYRYKLVYNMYFYVVCKSMPSAMIFLFRASEEKTSS